MALAGGYLRQPRASSNQGSSCPALSLPQSTAQLSERRVLYSTRLAATTASAQVHCSGCMHTSSTEYPTYTNVRALTRFTIIIRGFPSWIPPCDPAIHCMSRRMSHSAQPEWRRIQPTLAGDPALLHTQGRACRPYSTTDNTSAPTFPRGIQASGNPYACSWIAAS